MEISVTSQTVVGALHALKKRLKGTGWFPNPSANIKGRSIHFELRNDLGLLNPENDSTFASCSVDAVSLQCTLPDFLLSSITSSRNERITQTLEECGGDTFAEENCGDRN